MLIRGGDNSPLPPAPEEAPCGPGRKADPPGGGRHEGLKGSFSASRLEATPFRASAEGPTEEAAMAGETNETFRRGTRAGLRKRKRKWPQRLLKGVFWFVWVIDKGFSLISWLLEPPSG